MGVVVEFLISFGTAEPEVCTQVDDAFSFLEQGCGEFGSNAVGQCEEDGVCGGCE